MMRLIHEIGDSHFLLVIFFLFVPQPKNPSANMSEQQQKQQEELAEGMKQMRLDAKTYNTELKSMMTKMKTMKKGNYGMIEDELFAMPFNVSKGTVQLASTKRQREIAKIHIMITTIQKNYTTLSTMITENQKTTYKMKMLNMRQKKNVAIDIKRKKRKVDEAHKRDKLRQEENDMTEMNDMMSLFTKKDEDNEKDDDESLCPIDFS